LNLAEEMGEQEPGSKTKAFLNNLSVKIAHNTTCPDTRKYLADVIGQNYLYLPGYNAGGNPLEMRSGISGQSHLAHILEPIQFTKLAKPNSSSPYAEAIVWKSGNIFNSTITQKHPEGSNYLRVVFTRNIKGE
jgi:hypothetical protein